MERSYSEKNKSDISSDQNKPLSEIGRQIKETREQKGITLELLAEDLKINKGYLQAIEEADHKSLPEMIYVKAMIRRIAEKLQIEANLTVTNKAIPN